MGVLFPGGKFVSSNGGFSTPQPNVYEHFLRFFFSHKDFLRSSHWIVMLIYPHNKFKIRIIIRGSSLEKTKKKRNGIPLSVVSTLYKKYRKKLQLILEDHWFTAKVRKIAWEFLPQKNVRKSWLFNFGCKSTVFNWLEFFFFRYIFYGVMEMVRCNISMTISHCS